MITMSVVSIIESDRRDEQWAAYRQTATFAEMSNAMRGY